MKTKPKSSSWHFLNLATFVALYATAADTDENKTSVKFASKFFQPETGVSFNLAKPINKCQATNQVQKREKWNLSTSVSRLVELTLDWLSN